MYKFLLQHLVAVSAVEQLQVMASKRQYKEAAAQLEVHELLVVFHIFTSEQIIKKTFFDFICFTSYGFKKTIEENLILQLLARTLIIVPHSQFLYNTTIHRLIIKHLSVGWLPSLQIAGRSTTTLPKKSMMTYNNLSQILFMIKGKLHTNCDTSDCHIYYHALAYSRWNARQETMQITMFKLDPLCT